MNIRQESVAKELKDGLSKYIGKELSEELIRKIKDDVKKLVQNIDLGKDDFCIYRIRLKESGLVEDFDLEIETIDARFKKLGSETVDAIVIPVKENVVVSFDRSTQDRFKDYEGIVEQALNSALFELQKKILKHARTHKDFDTVHLTADFYVEKRLYKEE